MPISELGCLEQPPDVIHVPILGPVLHPVRRVVAILLSRPTKNALVYRADPLRAIGPDVLEPLLVRERSSGPCACLGDGRRTPVERFAGIVAEFLLSDREVSGEH